ncbi:MAG: hypothetical protein HYT62_02990 [Candidatus Yanofskybacteria bacterium]|nr:hypothetical protein [Candidatus Yanofskybacteria bacterium]
MPDRRALPASVFVPESTMKNIARKVAKITDEFIRRRETVILVRSGRYKANTDQVVMYNHESNLPRQYPKADLVLVVDCLVHQVPDDQRLLMCPLTDDESFLSFLRESWDESLELDSPVTLIVANNLRGALIDYYADSFAFFSNSSQACKE